MALMSGSNAMTTRANTIAARTGQSGGSVGGVKKAGIFAGSVAWSQGNMGRSVFWRAPQSQPTLAFALANTTRYPVQQRRNGYAVSHSGMLG
jgi:hypothetical protein